MGFGGIGGVALMFAGMQIAASPAHAAEGDAVNSSVVTTEHDSAHLEGHHHYQSAADEANDALLITEVKSALARDGVANNSAIVVDCDHGKILLSGVMKSAEDARHAGDIAAAADGVVAVKNQLTWH
jgi:osmotically-inducible protein OsmY